MSKRAEEKSIAYQLATHGQRVMGGDIILYEDDRNFWNINYDFLNGYEQAEKDLAGVAAFSSGPDGFYYGKGYQQGKKDAEKHLGWHSVDESLPPMGEEVIVLTNVINGRVVDLARYICFGHIVNKEYAVDYDGWNIPGVKYWMPCPELPEE